MCRRFDPAPHHYFRLRLSVRWAFSFFNASTMKIRITGQNFNNANLNSVNNFQFPAERLLWAAITVGRRRWNHVVRSKTTYEFEIMYRLSIIGANFETDTSGSLLKSQSYINLDASEKTAISFYFGMTMAKLLAEEYLSTPWLSHLGVYKNLFSRAGMPFRFQSKERPDLFGLDLNGNWIVIESKGRSSGLNTAMRKAKSQSTAISTIGNTPVSTCIGLVAFLKNQAEVFWQDPPSGSSQTNLDISKDEFLFDYYSLIYQFLKSTSPQLDKDFYVAQIGNIPLIVGLHRTIYESLEKSSSSLEIFSEKGIYGSDNGRTYIGKDGILVQVLSDFSFPVNQMPKF
jgi:hypothetical protein